VTRGRITRCTAAKISKISRDLQVERRTGACLHDEVCLPVTEDPRRRTIPEPTFSFSGWQLVDGRPGDEVRNVVRRNSACRALVEEVLNRCATTWTILDVEVTTAHVDRLAPGV